MCNIVFICVLLFYLNCVLRLYFKKKVVKYNDSLKRLMMKKIQLKKY